MTYPCPRCAFGALQPVKSPYVRQWGPYFVTVPDVAAHRCDCCGHTRYDMVALSRVTLVLGPESSPMSGIPRRRSLQTEGPSDRGPRSWSS